MPLCHYAGRAKTTLYCQKLRWSELLTVTCHDYQKITYNWKLSETLETQQWLNKNNAVDAVVLSRHQRIRPYPRFQGLLRKYGDSKAKETMRMIPHRTCMTAS